MNKSSGHELALNLRCKRIAFVYTYTYKTSAILLKRMCLNITSPVLAARGRKRTRAVRVTRHMQNPNRFPNIWRSSLIYQRSGKARPAINRKHGGPTAGVINCVLSQGAMQGHPKRNRTNNDRSHTTRGLPLTKNSACNVQVTTINNTFESHQ